MTAFERILELRQALEEAQALIHQLEARNGHEGHVYVIEWSSGWVTIGASAYPRRRISDYRVEKARLGITVNRTWVSAKTPQFRKIVGEVKRGLCARDHFGAGAFERVVESVRPDIGEK